MAAEETLQQRSRTSSLNTGSHTLALRWSWASGKRNLWGFGRTRSSLPCGAPRRVVVFHGMTTWTSTGLLPDQCSGFTCITRCAGSSTSCRHLYPRIKPGPRSKTHMSNSAVNLVWTRTPIGRSVAQTEGSGESTTTGLTMATTLLVMGSMTRAECRSQGRHQTTIFT